MIITDEDVRVDKETQESPICPLPWKQVQVSTLGNVSPCCIWTGKIAGNLNENSLEDIWNGYTFKKLRRDMLHGKKPEGCQKCWLLEDLHTKSPRWYAYRKYLTDMKDLAETVDPLGTQEMKIECWDIRFSNQCNLACRTCGPEASSKWYSEAAQVFGSEWVKRLQSMQNPEISRRLLFYLVEHLEDASEIYFVGGEPLIMPEHYEVLEAILRGKYKDVYLRYNTNLTTLGKDEKAIRYWKELKAQGNKIEVGLSIDAVGKVAEYVRHGCRWSTVESNLQKLLDNDIHIMVMPTVSVLNIWHVQDLLDFCIEKGISGFDIANANIVVGPSHYDMRILPERYKEDVINRITKYLEDHESEEEQLYGVRHKFFDPILEFLKEKPQFDVQKARQEFIRVTKALDLLRGESFTEINGQFGTWERW